MFRKIRFLMIANTQIDVPHRFLWLLRLTIRLRRPLLRFRASERYKAVETIAGRFQDSDFRLSGKGRFTQLLGYRVWRLRA
jgi:hypothetical protein